jgi:hypothetical protein
MFGERGAVCGIAELASVALIASAAASVRAGIVLNLPPGFSETERRLAELEAEVAKLRAEMDLLLAVVSTIMLRFDIFLDILTNSAIALIVAK